MATKAAEKKFRTKSALSFFGSDSEVAPKLARLLMECSHVTIPFVGGGSIIPFLTARAIVASDKHCAAINFYRTISGVYGDQERFLLVQRCEATLSHPNELELAEDVNERPDCYAPHMYAWSFWARCWVGRKGKGGTKYMGGMPSVRRTPEGGTNATRVRAAAGDLKNWSFELARCEWEDKCFRDLIPQVSDSKGCGIYCDPPWMDDGSKYEHSFTEDDHRELAELLSHFNEAAIVVRYGDHPDIRELYSEGWTIIDANSRTQANKSKPEIWIVANAEVPPELRGC